MASVGHYNLLYRSVG